MNDKFSIKTVSEQPAMVIRASAPQAEIGAKMSEMFPKLMAFAMKNKLQPQGVPFALYHFMSPSKVDFECGIPVAATISGDEDVQPGSIPGGKAVSVMHIGPYDTLGDTYQELSHWMKEHNHPLDNVCWEMYITDPQEVENPAEWQTEIFWLID